MNRPGINIRPHPMMEGLTEYRPPRHGAPVDLNLDGNEGPCPPPSLIDAMVEAGTKTIRRYPDAGVLEGRIARLRGLDPNEVLVTAGADDAIARALRVVLGPGREVIVTQPTFEMIERYAKLTGCIIVQVPWMEGSFPTDAILNKVNERTALIAVVTPNNPTGLVAKPEDLRRLSADVPQALILVDLAYTEFADEDLTACALGLPNAVTVRSMSKAWGMAGLRVGWAAGPREVVGWMRAAGHPYAVSGPSIQMALARIGDGLPQDVACFIDRVREERAVLIDLLRRLRAKPLPSQSNFVLARFADSCWMRDGLAGMGIAVRSFPGRECLNGYLRITLPGDEFSFGRLVSAIETAINPQAILFDMDDTMVDVTDSYRLATVATADYFGARATYDDITAAKAAGSANNDWELTWRLIQGQGANVPFDEVKERFEILYQGRDGKPGLRFSERILSTRALFERLSARAKLGVVTGRPRDDAMRFLREQNIDDLFGTVVSMEDGPPKPDPSPVRLAMARLGVTRAWMVGDTPDDISAARSAGVLPIGVIAPADDPETARAALTNAGAARILEKLSDIEEVIR